MSEESDNPLTPRQACSFLGNQGFAIAEGTLAHKRVHGDGPEFLKFGARILYRPSALRAWVEATAKPMTSTATVRAA